MNFIFLAMIAFARTPTCAEQKAVEIVTAVTTAGLFDVAQLNAASDAAAVQCLSAEMATVQIPRKKVGEPKRRSAAPTKREIGPGDFTPEQKAPFEDAVAAFASKKFGKNEKSVVRFREEHHIADHPASDSEPSKSVR